MFINISIQNKLTNIDYQNILQFSINNLYSAMASFFRWYSSILDRRPFVTRVLTSATIASMGDTMAQLWIEKKGINYDFHRNFTLTMTGLTLFAPFSYLWYNIFLPKFQNMFLSKFSKITKVLSKTIINSFIYAPMLFCGFFIYNQILSQRSLMGYQKGLQNLKDKLWQSLTVNWTVWPAANIINFWFIQIKYQVLFLNFVSFFWTIFFSYLVYRQQKHKVDQNNPNQMQSKGNNKL